MTRDQYIIHNHLIELIKPIEFQNKLSINYKLEMIYSAIARVKILNIQNDIFERAYTLCILCKTYINNVFGKILDTPPRFPLTCSKLSNLRLM